MKWIIACAFVLSAMNVFAKSASTLKRQPTNIAAQGSFKFEVNNGDKVTEFVVWSDKGQPKFFARSNEGRENSGKLSKKNYQFLLKETSTLMKLPGTKAESCPRANMVLIYELEKKNVGCIELKNNTTKKMAQFANMMSYLL